MSVSKSASVAVAALLILTPAALAADSNHDLVRFAQQKIEHAIAKIGDDAYVHGGSITGLHLLGRRGIVAASHGKLSLFEAANGKHLATIHSSFAPAPSCRGEFMLLPWRPEKSFDQYLEVWNLLTNERISKFKHSTYITSSAVTSDGKTIAVVNGSGSVELLDAGTGRSLAVIPPPQPRKHNVAGYPQVEFTADGSKLILHDFVNGNTYDYHFLQLDAERKIGKESAVKKFEGYSKLLLTRDKDKVLLVGNSGHVILYDVAASKDACAVKHDGVSALGADVDPSGGVLATCGADGYIRLWSLPTGQPIGELNTGERHPFAVAFSDDDGVLISGGGHGRVRFWEWRTGQEFKKGPEQLVLGAVHAIAISPQGDRIASAGDLGDVQMWDVKTGLNLGLLEEDPPPGGRFDPRVGPQFLAFTSDGSTLVGGSNNRHNSVNFWDAASLERWAKGKAHRWPITAVACSSDLFFSGSRDNTVRIWNSDGQPVHHFEGPGQEILTLAVSPDGSRLAGAGFSNEVFVWDIPQKALLRKYEVGGNANSIGCLAFGADNKTLLASFAGTDPLGRQPGDSIYFWDLQREDDQPVRTLTVKTPGRSYGARSIAVDPHGQLIAVSGADGRVTVWDFASCQQLAKLRGHRAAVMSVAWSRQGDRLVSGSLDDTMIVWDITSAIEAQRRLRPPVQP